MNTQPNKPIIIDENAEAPANAFVIRKLRDGTFRIDETGTEIQLNEDNTLTVRLKYNQKDLKTVPKENMITDAYRHRAQDGQWWRFAQHDNQLTITKKS